MILLDISGTIFSAIHVDLKAGEVNEKHVRHLILNSVRNYNQLFRDEYGELVICTDGTSWRKTEFPLYKWERKQGRDADDNDWESIFQTVEQVLADIEEHFPYKVVSQINSEADDIIGALARASEEPVLIISNDKDLAGETKKPNVDQWRPLIANRNRDHKSGFIEMTCEEARRFEFDLIITGDKSDGIPSIKCGDEFFKTQYEARAKGETPVRAPAITQKWKQELWEIFNHSPTALKEHLGEEYAKNFLRNYKLISLSCTPQKIVDSIHDEFKRSQGGNEMKAMTYMIDNNMPLLAKHISDFRPSTKPQPKTKNLFGATQL